MSKNFGQSVREHNTNQTLYEHEETDKVCFQGDEVLAKFAKLGGGKHFHALGFRMLKMQSRADKGFKE